MGDMGRAEQALQRLRERIAGESRLLVAFSGGVDSALLAMVAAQVLGQAVIAVTAVSPSLPASERATARRLARTHGIQHVEVCTDEQDRPAYQVNGADRCYHCKQALFEAVAPMARMLGASVALGTNLDDLGDHRPGLRAAEQWQAIAPLVDAGLDKALVRQVARLVGLEVADKPAAACLASRVAYGDPVTPELLGKIEGAEEAVRGLGFSQCRVRAHAAGTVARLEVPAADITRAVQVREELDAALRRAGFEFAALDLAGFVSGRMNVLLGTPHIRTSDREVSR